MKKVFYLFLLFVLPLSIQKGFSQEGHVNPEKVDLVETTKGWGPRSVSNVPFVWLFPGEDTYLSIGFNVQNSLFSVIIKNEQDQTVYTADLLADGSAFEYNISFLSGGNYTLVIKNDVKEYKGIFTVCDR